MKRIVLFLFLVSTFIGFTSKNSHASHVTGGEISYTWVSGNTYQINLYLYRDCNGIAMSNTETVYVASVNCGLSNAITLNRNAASVTQVVPVCPSIQTTCNGGLITGIERHEYTGTYTFPAACNDWTISYLTCCRSSQSLTLNNPGSTSFGLFMTLDNVQAVANSSPQFSDEPVLVVFANQPAVINNGLYESDGDSMSIELAAALDQNGTPVSYASGYSPLSPIQSSAAIAMDPVSGDLTFTPSAVGAYTIVYKVNEFRNGVLITSVMRENMVLVVNSSNQLPFLASPPSNVQSVCYGSTLNMTLAASDPDASDSARISALAFNVPSSQYNAVFSPANDSVQISFTPDSTLISSRPYFLQFTIQDNACPVNGSRHYTIAVFVNNCSGNVWPGDANADLTVDQYDLFSIGLAYGENGPVRPGASTNWVSQPGVPWSTSYLSGSNKMHGDCDGNGTIDSLDIQAINQNFGLTHPLRLGAPNPIEMQNALPLYLVINPDSIGPSGTFNVEVRAGTSTLPVDALYGIGFRITYNASLIDTTASEFMFTSSWFGNPGSNLLSLVKPRWDAGQMDVSAVRVNHLDASGDSTIAVFSIVVVDNISARQVKTFTIENARGITYDEVPVYFSVRQDSVIINANPVGIDKLKAEVSVSPNPARSSVLIRSHSFIESLEIFSGLGISIRKEENVQSKSARLDLSDIPQGLYFLKANMENGAATMPLIIE